MQNNNRCFIVAEIGINHNGSLDIAKQLIDMAKACDCDAVKFQKRTIDKVYTQEELDKERITPFGKTNRDLKEALEFSFDEYCQIDEYCKKKEIEWFASCWDKDSVDFIEQFQPKYYKIPSALLTNSELIKYTVDKRRFNLLSTGMSTINEIDRAYFNIINNQNNRGLALYHCTSTYPSKSDELNLNCIKTLKDTYCVEIGYSGHEKGITPSILAASLGAFSVERHITLDRTMFGSDQAASLEYEGLHKMVRDIRQLDLVLGDGIKKVYDSELSILEKLRR